MISRTFNEMGFELLTVCVAATIALVCVIPTAQAAGTERGSEVGTTHRNPVEDLRVVLVQAIDAPDGQAHAVLAGASAEAITAKFKATSQIFVDVSTLKRYSQEGCRRLRLALWQDGVVLPGPLGASGPQRRSVSFDLNYCRDGSPPASLSEEPR